MDLVGVERKLPCLCPLSLCNVCEDSAGLAETATAPPHASRPEWAGQVAHFQPNDAISRPRSIHWDSLSKRLNHVLQIL